MRGGLTFSLCFCAGQRPPRSRVPVLTRVCAGNAGVKRAAGGWTQLLETSALDPFERLRDPGLIAKQGMIGHVVLPLCLTIGRNGFRNHAFGSGGRRTA